MPQHANNGPEQYQRNCKVENAVGVLLTLAIEPLVAGHVLQIEIRSDKSFGNIIADASCVLDKKLFDVVTRHFSEEVARLN